METSVFDTRLGMFGIGWTDVGIARLQLPGLNHAEMTVRINRNGAMPGQPPRDVDAVINRLEDYADGVHVDFDDVAFIPCHCVLASNGRTGGFTAPGGADAKRRMLALEGIVAGVPANQMSFGF